MHLDQDLLNWWKEQKNTFPRLSALAHGMLAIPATSVWYCRPNLAPNKVNKVVFVHNNVHLVHEMNTV